MNMTGRLIVEPRARIAPGKHFSVTFTLVKTLHEFHRQQEGLCQ